MIQLGHEVHTSVSIGGKVLNIVGEDLAVADKRADVVERVGSGHEETYVFERAEHASHQSDRKTDQRPADYPQQNCAKDLNAKLRTP